MPNTLIILCPEVPVLFNISDQRHHIFVSILMAEKIAVK